MSKLAIKLLSYFGLLDIPEEKIKKYLHRYKPRRGTDSIPHEVSRRKQVQKSRKAGENAA